MNLYPVIFTVLAFVSTMLGGLIAARYKGRFGDVLAFASGVLIAVPLFDLLPETIKLAVSIGVPIDYVMYSVALGFIALYVLSRYISVHHICEEDVCHNVRHKRGGLFSAAELSAHSFLDGFAIGLSFHVDFQVGIIVAIAVISHDFSDGINTVTVMLRSGNSLKSSLRMLLVDASTPILGAVSTIFFTIPERFLILILPFFAGGFLYLGAGDLLPEAHEQNPPVRALAASIAGFLLIFAVARFLKV